MPTWKLVLLRSVGFGAGFACAAYNECLNGKQEDGETPYVLTSVFMRDATSQKSPLDRMFAEQEKLKA